MSAPKPGRGELHALSRALLAVVIGVALFQLFARLAYDTSSWKGGGYGMYADFSPATHRTLWVEVHSDSERRAVRIAPPGPEMVRWREGLSPEEDDAFRPLRRELRRSRIHPAPGKIRRLANALRELSADGPFAVRPAGPPPDSLVLYMLQIRPSPAERRIVVEEVVRGAAR